MNNIAWITFIIFKRRFGIMICWSKWNDGIDIIFHFLFFSIRINTSTGEDKNKFDFIIQ